MVEGVTEEQSETDKGAAGSSGSRSDSKRRSSGKDGRSGKAGGGKRRGARPGPRRGTQQDEPQTAVRELAPLPGEPRILERTEHNISRKNIDSDCLKVMGRLIRYGHRAFLVGGGVRDLLLEREPKDFDVGTDASPEQIRKLFRNSRVIGRRFRLNHVFFKDGKTIEVSTFRQEQDAEDGEEVETLARDNTYGDPQTDALRRDLTINGLFYDLHTFSVVDYVGGIEDLEQKIVRVIGEPDVRFTEDPVRMLRAVRHAARTGFTIEPATYDSIKRLADKILLCPKARIYEEFQREIAGGYSVASFTLLEETGLLAHLFPLLAECIAQSAARRELFYRRLAHIDSLHERGSQPRLGLLFGAVLFDLVDAHFEENDVLLQYWRSEPDFEQSVEEQSTPKSSSKSRRRVSPLLQSIDMLFGDMGLPRKERERLERALVGRFSLLEYSPDDAFGRRVRRSSSFEDALSLAHMVDFEGTQKERLEAWRAPKSGNTEQPKRRKRRRRRKKRSDKERGGNSDE